MNERAREESTTLEVLPAMDNREDVRQRHLAKRLGVAESRLETLCAEGAIKVGRALAKRHFCYLTPKGFAGKSRLTAKYLHIPLASILRPDPIAPASD